MPRNPNHFKKSGPALAPGKADAGSTAGEERRVIITPANAAAFKPSPGAVSSVFAMGATPQKRPRVQVDLASIKVHKALPIPPRNGGAEGQSKYAAIWAQLAAGDCAELSDRQAHGLASWCKKQKHAFTVRRLTPATKGVWRTA